MPHAWFGALLRAASGGHTALVSSFYSVELRWVQQRLPSLTPFLRWSIEASDGVTAISSATAKRVRSLADRPVRVIPFGAALEPPTDVPIRPPLAEDRPLELLFVGRLVERKGVETIVRALPRVLERRSARLTVVGEGEWAPVIREAVARARVEPHVRMTGQIPATELERMYADADIFVLPAVIDRKGDTEGLGVVLLEAMRFGLPAIASAVGGIPDIVRDGQTGWLVEPGDPGALARRILAVADQPSTSRRVAQRGREWVAERFGLSRIATDLIDCYRDAIATRRGP
jgi:glycosyltransferase involved in cell wall biosynthesis